MTIKKTVLSAAVATVMGVAVAPQAAMADIITADWTGMFTMLTSTGAALGNTSITAKGANTYQTPVTGTMTFDTATGAGSATLVPFDFYNGSLPAEAVGINLQAIGDGAGGQGSLVLGNMLFNWNGVNGIPVSIVMDAAGFFGGMMGGLIGDGNLTQAEVAGFGAVPASDGTYVGATVPNTNAGYLALGPAIMSTTEWNTTLAAGCTNGVDSNYADNTGGGCMGVGVSGALPLVVDNAANGNEYAMGDGVGVGGVPMPDGPFTGFNANFDITALTNIVVTPVPVPAAAWLLGSGLVGLVGVARRRKA